MIPKLLPITTLALSLLTALPTFARLGETKAECEARYGKPVRTSQLGNTVYRKADLDLTITFSSDKAVVLFIAKTTPGVTEHDVGAFDADADKRGEISKVQIDVLLQASKGASNWTSGSEFDQEGTWWQRDDGKASAQYSNHVLKIADDAYLAAKEEEDKKKEAEPFKDFARLGESKDQFEKRCGKPVKTNPDGTLLYQKAGLKITATFWKEKAVHLIIFKEAGKEDSSDPFAGLPDPLGLENRTVISENALDAIVNASSASSTWEKEPGITIKWTRSDQKASATYAMDKALLNITDQEFAAHQVEEHQKQEAKDLDGF
ncbi:hypothetical protein [Luteolibacter soli]|uniref:Uncharacterized protein n=1 Tax=Luteolibacter soli TaxID=3135280 RepID=A0ABU9AW15_9BACT